MTAPPAQQVTQLLLAWSQGEESALEKLTPVVYEELRRLAHRYMGWRAGGSHAADNRAGQRSLFAADRWQASELAEPGPLLCYLGPLDAAHPGGLGACPRNLTSAETSLSG